MKKHGPIAGYSKETFSRRIFLKQMGAAAAVSLLPGCRRGQTTHPNIILCMADDLGWGDTGYNGHAVLKTPNLDLMSRSGLRFDRFYSAAPVCSPTRGSCLTGRHPYRYGIFGANVGHMPEEEVTLAEVLKPLGYRTGHFGKWHLGTLTKTIPDSNRGGEKGKAHYSPPWENGFDVCFSTEAKVPTYDPQRKPTGWPDRRWWNPIGPEQAFEDYNTRYWTGPDEFVREDLAGDDSELIIDRAEHFMRDAADKGRPFFAVIWFHAPHWPVVAGERFRNRFASLDEFSQNHFGCIAAMDAQIGRLRSMLTDLGIRRETMFWFCSDNGPEGTEAGGDNHGVGSAGPLRGRKRSLFEGGIRVPGLLEWPARIGGGRKTQVPCCTSDYFPTILNVLGIRAEGRSRTLDGISLLPLIEGKMKSRPVPIAFESRNQLALIDNRFKIVSQDSGEAFLLFDIIVDPGESKNISQEHPDVLNSLVEVLQRWRKSCSEDRKKSSLTG